MLSSFIAALVLFWLRERFLGYELQYQIESGELDRMYHRLEKHQNKIFLAPGYCKGFTKLWDCSEEDLKERILPGVYRAEVILVGWLVELFAECSGIGEIPLSKFFFTGW